MQPLRLAILDLYDNTPNQGMRCIQEIVSRYDATVEWSVFDVRGKAEVPDLSYDIYISTGGPGSPHDGDGIWDKRYYDWLEEVWQWNLNQFNSRKYVFFICHSFQMAVKHFKLADVPARRSMSFGTFRCHLTEKGFREPCFDGLPNPFYVADFRNWQVIQPDMERFEELGAEILALEKKRPHIPLERAIMAIRFSEEMFGTQFHPEADPDGMLKHFMDPERRMAVINEHSKDKYLRMIDHLNDSDKIGLTHDIVLPSFLERSIRAFQKEPVAAS